MSFPRHPSGRFRVVDLCRDSKESTDKRSRAAATCGQPHPALDPVDNLPNTCSNSTRHAGPLFLQPVTCAAAARVRHGTGRRVQRSRAGSSSAAHTARQIVFAGTPSATAWVTVRLAAPPGCAPLPRPGSSRNPAAAPAAATDRFPSRGVPALARRCCSAPSVDGRSSVRHAPTPAHGGRGGLSVPPGTMESAERRPERLLPRPLPPGSGRSSPRPRPPRPERGRQSRPARTRWWSRRPARARPSPPSCGRWTT